MIEIATNDQELLSNDKALYFTVNAFCSWIFTPQDLVERPMFYLACPECKKKMTDQHNGFECARCNKTYDNAVPTYNFSCKISDVSSSITVRCLGEVGEAFVGIPCEAFYSNMKDDLDLIKEQTSKSIMNKLQILLRVKADRYEGGSQSAEEGPRLVYSVSKVSPC